MRRGYILLLSAALLAGCSGNTQNVETSVEITTTEEKLSTTEEIITTTESQKPDENAETEYELDATNSKLIGRTQLQNHVRWMSYSGTGVEFKATGKKLSMMLYGDSTAVGGSSDPENNNRNGNRARYAVYLDDEQIMDEIMDEGAKEIVIFEGDEIRESVVRLVKLSETANSSIGIRSVTVVGGDIQPTEEKKHLIEFVGDSITCGYGVDDEDRNHSFSTSTEDATKAYAIKTAELLDSDYSLVSISGYGIISGYTSNGEKHDNQVLSKYYDKLGFSYAKAGGFTVSSWDWDFSVRQPDAVVVNLGTNDASYVKNDADKKQEFVDEYVVFLKHIREKNPNAYIVCALGMMGDDLYPAVEEAANRYKEETGDESIATFHFDGITAAEGYAADWHPTQATHERCAKEFAEFLGTFIK